MVDVVEADIPKLRIADIEAAARTIAGQVVRTPLVPAPDLSRLAGTEVWLKLETLQATASFKDRGSCVKLTALDAEARARGVIACSAGNHAQGVAYHAHRLGIPATIVMPNGTPFSKIARTERFGARVVLHGDGLDTAEDHAHQIAEVEALTFVHPYDDPLIIAGQGTVGLEMLADCPELDTLIVPIGGGGLMAGVAIAAKARKPGIQLIGVEAALYPFMSQALRGEAAVPTPPPGATIAEGIAVKRAGRITREIIGPLVDDIVLLDERALEAAVQTAAEVCKVTAEGAGAAGIGALLAQRARFAGRKVGIVVCGGNIDARLLSTVLMRGLMRDERLARLRIDIPDQPGVLGRVAAIIGSSGGNIVHVQHQRFYYDMPVRMTELDIVLETRGPGHVKTVKAMLEEAGFPARLQGGTRIEEVAGVGTGAF